MHVASHVQRRQGPRRVFAALLAVVLASVVVWADHTGWGSIGSRGPFGPGSTSGTTPCDDAVVRIIVAPRIESVLRTALDSVQRGGCPVVEVEERREREALDAVFFGADPPDLWIPDGDWGVAKMPVEVVSPALASTPVLLVGGPNATPAPTWGAALTSGTVAMPDPLTDSVGTIAMLAPRQEAVARGGDVQAARSFLVPTAQAYGEVAADGREVEASLDSLTATSSTVVATTEEDFLAAGATNRALRAVVPRTGAALMRFPLTVRNDATPAAHELADDLVAWFSSDDGLAALRRAGLRRGDGRPIAAGTGLGRLGYLPAPSEADVDDYRFTWQVMSVPSSVLAVFDVSGSMDFASDDGTTRIDVATGAAEMALDLFPGHARVGLWAFSIDQGGPGQDWRVLEPLRRLDADVGGATQRERLADRSAGLASLTTGGTGLYDTALAAYRQALDDYDSRYANSVILLTDGANDDPGSITGAALLRRLRALRDPQRPVRIIGVAISADADLRSLRRIAEATGGRAHRADVPEDILRVFASEISGR